ncbi:MAG: hypothetical protein IT258_03045 [Saprospiraceae bacterium]|nr:hypothetical protein [Saprospiraceae bacterium]
MKKLGTLALSLAASHLFGQTPQKLSFNEEYSQLSVSAATNLVYEAKLEKGKSYQFAAMQLGIDVMLVLQDENSATVKEMDSPNGKYGKEIFEFSPPKTGAYRLTIKRFEEEGNTDNGKVSFYVKRFSEAEMRQREQAKKALETENVKNTLTLDIDHFWEAYDALKNCKTHYDSVTCIQNLYFDRGTVGLQDFIEQRNWYADDFVKVLRDSAAFYQSVREKTYAVKQSEPIIQEVYEEMKSLYAGFKPFKVCFAIGKMRTGGTVSGQFLLLGTELTTTGDPAKIPQRIKGLVTHESVHTQQPEQLDSNAIVCNQLYFCLREGAANFIGQLISGTTNYGETDSYGEAHEAELWEEFKSTLCRNDTSNWLYNGDTAKGRPADLGYYIGYKICQAYYNNATDKRQAVADIIEKISDPVAFLQKSGYDRQPKK